VLLAICAVAQADERAGAHGGERVVPKYRIVPRTFTHEDGLPQSGVNDIVQDRDGYLWLGTFGGLARFDGSTFRIFRERSASGPRGAMEGRRAGPASDRVLSLFEDDRGRLWIGTQDAGLSVYERGAFRHLPICGGVCQVSDVEQGPDRSIWVASGDGVFRVDPGSMRAIRFARPKQDGYDHVVIDGAGRVFVAGYTGLHMVAGDGLRDLPLPKGSTYVRVLERDGDDLLVGTDQRLYRYRHDDRRWTPQDVPQPRYAVRDAHGWWWVAQENRQAMREQGPGRWRPVPELSGVGISSLVRDDDGNLWVGTTNRGLLRLRDPLFGLLSETQLGTGASGRAVAVDGDGGLWLGLSCSALRHLGPDGRLRTWPIRDVVGDDCISGLLLDRDGVLWIGTSAGTLGRLADGAVEQVASWGGGNSVSIGQADDGRLLVGAGASTYVLRQSADGRPPDFRRLWALEGMRVNQIVPAVRGGTWLVGDLGAVRLVRDRVVERWSPQEGLSSRFARALYEDRDGTLWIGTYGGGLNRIAGGRVHRYGSDNGLSDEAVSCILPDGHGRLWLGGNRGVTLLPVPEQAGETIESLAFAAYDGLTPAEINGGTSSACLRDVRGRLWFSLVEGFAVLDPVRVEHLRSTPLRAHVEDVSAAGAPLEPADGVLRLPAFTRNLQIRYTAINLSRPRETRFRFRLSGFDADWVEAGQNRTILYPSIPWGEHLFEVQARIAGGPWSPTASLRIAHPQPWYQRPWIWTLATSMGLVVLLGATRHERARPQPVRRRRGGSVEPGRVEPKRVESERSRPS
jgi:ligand-binding sensor domain-containing protein